MASLKDIFGLSRKREMQDTVAEDIRENTGDFAVPVFNSDTGEEVRVLYFESAKDFESKIRSNCMVGNGECFDLSGKDLSGLDFTETQELYGARFDNSNLTGTAFKGSDLTGGSFKNCVMYNTDMTKTIIRYADFSHADMQNAHLEGAKANRTKFTHVNATGAYLGGLIAPDTDFMQADLTRAVTTDMDIKGANMHFTKITRAQMTDCKNADKAQFMTASYLMRKAGRKRTL